MRLAWEATAQAERGGRALLLASLALNLFFVGAAGALLVRHSLAPPAAPAVIDRSAAGRIERLAATLPDADARTLRETFRADTAHVEAAQADYRASQEVVRAALRREPFDTERLRAAMGQSRAARQKFDESLQNLIASAAARMSAAGRSKLADWPPHRSPPPPATR